MAKKIRTTIVVLVLLMSFLTIFVVMLDSFSFDMVEREAPDLPLYYDPGDTGKLDLDVPDENASQDEIKAFVVDLYNLACTNYQNAEKAAFEVRYTTNMIIMSAANIPVPGTRFCVKDGDKRYYLDFTIPGEDMLKFMDGIMGDRVPPQSSHYAEATYTDASMDYVVSRKVYKDCGGNGIGAGPLYAEDGSIQVDWTPAVVSEQEKTVYAAYQDGQFHHTDHSVTVDTILEASVTYSKEYGYYTCEFTLDPQKVPEELLNSLRTNSGQPSAVYTKLVQTMTVWDTGYLRTYHALDYWQTDGNFMASELDFETIYYYDNEPEKIDIGNYPYMAAMCHK